MGKSCSTTVALNVLGSAGGRGRGWGGDKRQLYSDSGLATTDTKPTGTAEHEAHGPILAH